MKKLTFSFILGASLLFPASTVFSEEVRMTVGSSTSGYSGSLPAKGSTKDQVEAQFGSPNSKNGPSGQPPIYFWEYSDFTVYFESDYVIHTVLKNLK